MNEPPILRAMGCVVILADSLGVRGMNALPGCWEHQIDEQWWIALNAHGHPVKCSRDIEVQGFTCYVEFNGWPAGTFTPFEGVIAAGAAANEQAFCEACERASGTTAENA